MKKERKLNLKRSISLVLTIIVVILIAWYLKNNKEVFKHLREIRFEYIAIIALLQIVNIGLSAAVNMMVIESIDQRISYADAFLLQYANNLLNKFISEGGAVYRGAYLKARYGFPISKFLSSVGGVYIISLMANSVIGIIFLLTIFFIDHLFNLPVLILLLLFLVGSLTLLLFTPKFKKDTWFFRRINSVIDGWNKIKSDKRLVWKISLLSVLSLLVSSVSVFTVYKGLNTDIQIMNSIFYSSISGLVNIVNITPGNLGITEAVLMFSSEIIGISDEIVVLGALLLRVVTLVTTLILGSISYLILTYKLNKSSQ